MGTPTKGKLGGVIAAAAIDADPEAAILGVAATCAAAGFVTVKENVYGVAAVSDCPTVRVNVPALQAPLDAVAPSENLAA